MFDNSECLQLQKDVRWFKKARLNKIYDEIIDYEKSGKIKSTLKDVVDYFAEQKLQAYLNEHPEAVHQKKF